MARHQESERNYPMSEKQFFLDSAKAQATATIKEIEAQTAAEIVVALRKDSGCYRASDYLWGCILAFMALIVMLLVPHHFHPLALPIDLGLAFVVGTAISTYSPALRRLLAPRSLMKRNVRRAAREALVDLGVTNTSGRWGVLVYLSMLERRAEVVVDIGVDQAAMSQQWTDAVTNLQTAMQQADFSGFIGALNSMGPCLSKILPHRAGDVNELPDQVNA